MSVSLASNPFVCINFIASEANDPGVLSSVSNILTQEGLSEEHRSQALALASATGHSRAVSLILQKGPVMPIMREAAFIAASKAGVLTCVMSLNEGASIPHGKKFTAGVMAAEKGHKDVLMHLFQTCEFSWAEKSRIQAAALVNGQESCLDYVKAELNQNAILGVASVGAGLICIGAELLINSCRK